jgi:hypothetical protein
VAAILIGLGIGVEVGIKVETGVGVDFNNFWVGVGVGSLEVGVGVGGFGVGVEVGWGVGVGDGVRVGVGASSRLMATGLESPALLLAPTLRSLIANKFSPSSAVDLARDLRFADELPSGLDNIVGKSVQASVSPNHLKVDSLNVSPLFISELVFPMRLLI